MSNEEFARQVNIRGAFKDVMEIVPSKPVFNIGPEHMIIPECCREGWDSCPHIPKRQRKTKKNIGL